jgi:TetR/AcrR family transcriptional regulator of autoinduction and epiphytic fitness
MNVDGTDGDRGGAENDEKEPRSWRDGAEQTDRVPRDGRAARAVRTRQAVVDALLILIEEGELRPTSKYIAERAGVSERTIFQHFEDLETLFSAAAERMGEGIVRNLGVIADDGPLDVRLSSYLDELVFLHESMTPIRRASRLHEPFSPVIRCALGIWRANLRRGIERVFAIELRRWSEEASRHDAIEALALIVTWSSWENMRTNSGLTCEQARRVMELGIRALLAGPAGVARI